MRLLVLLITALLIGVSPIRAQSVETVSFASAGAGGATLTAQLKRPSGVAKPPVVIALHGCSGLLTRSGALQKREADWMDRLVGWGYAALFVDSFNPRGFREVCTIAAAQRPIRPGDRAKDVAAALAWVGGQPGLDASRVALIGWSHGGSSTLWSVDARQRPLPPEIKTAIAFYPGCRPIAAREGWQARAPLAILIGSKDDWTSPEPCRALVARHKDIRYIEYAGAFHGFDAPDSPVRIREGLGTVGRAHVGTDPKARAAAITEVEQILKAALR